MSANVPNPPDRSLLGRPAFVALFSVAIAQLLLSGYVTAALGVKNLVDTDDGMRLFRVRHLLNGDGWFNLAEPRVNPGAELSMHWTHLLDAPLAVMIRLFEPVLGVDYAERITLVLWPALLLWLTFWVLAEISRLLSGPRSMLPVTAAFFFSIIGVSQFKPGRIDHHSAQILLAGVVLLGLLKARSDRRYAILAGAAAGLSMAINLENLPFLVVLGGAYAAIGMRNLPASRLPLRNFAISSAIALPFFYFISNGRLGDTSCDALSMTHTVPGSLFSLALGLFLSFRPGSRYALVTSGLAVAAGCAAASYYLPLCTANPLATVDPLVVRVWLKNVVEARSLADLALNRDLILSMVPPIAIGIAGAAWAAWKTRTLAWGLVIGCGLMALAMAFWQNRVLSTGAFFAALGVGAFIPMLMRYAAGRTWKAAAVALAAAPFLAATAWQPVLASLNLLHEPTQSAAAGPAGCHLGDFETLASLPRSLVLAPIDLGPTILLATPHDILGAPYHRNNGGNSTTIRSFVARPDVAYAILKERGVNLVVSCRGSRDQQIYAAENVDGLMAHLLNGRIPGWLTRIDPGTGPVAIYRIN